MDSSIEARAGRREWLGLAVLALPALLVGMDMTALNLAVPSLSEDLQPTSSQLLWIVDIYGFLSGGALITMGTLGDRIGRRRLLLLGSTAFALASVLAALSPSAPLLIAARGLLGLAGATLMPSALSLASHMFSHPTQRRMAIGAIIASFSGGTAIGPVFGGVLLEHFWWGSVFLLGVPVMGVLRLSGPRLLPEYRDPRAGRVDLLSVVLSLAAVLLVVYGFKRIAEGGAGSEPVLLIAAGALAGAFFVRRQQGLPDPLIDLRLFHIVAFTAALATLLLGIFVLQGSYLYVGQYLQLVLDLSPTEAGLWTVPGAVGVVVGSTLAPKLVPWAPPARLIGGGLLLAALGFVALVQLDGASGLALVVPATFVISLGLGPVMTLTTDLVVASAPPARASAAASISETSGVLGGALGIALVGSLSTAVYRGEMDDAMPTGITSSVQEEARHTLGGAVAAAGDLPEALGSPLLEAARAAFLQGIHVAAAVSAVLMAATAVAAVALLRRSDPAGPAPSPQADAPMSEPEDVVAVSGEAG